MPTFFRSIASVLVVSVTLLGLPMSAHAGLVPTATAISKEELQLNRDKVQNFLERADVRAGLQAHGLNADDAAQRVQAMSDSEVAELAGRIDQAPAGGDVLGLVFLVFIILLVTDILGLTKVFPFTRAVR